MAQLTLQHSRGDMAGVPPFPDRDHCNGYPRLSRGAMAFSHLAWKEIQIGLKLSGRELQIVQGIFDNKLEYSIAAELGISINTVRTELRRLRRKLNAADRVSLVLCVVEEFFRQRALAKSQLPALCHRQSTGNCPLLHPEIPTTAQQQVR
jgi:DNA-binding CsgD family transcriptional regulator